MGVDIVTAATLDGSRLDGLFWGHLSEDQRQDLRDLVTWHGINVDSVRSVSYDVIDAPLLRLRIYLEDRHGRRRLESTGAECATETREVLLRTHLPDWWQPATEPGGPDGR